MFCFQLNIFRLCSNTKQGAKNARGGKKQRTANDDNNNNDDEENEHTRFDRFWEVPLTLEKDGNLLANLTKDTCLVPAEQITLRDFHEPSQIDTTYEEVCFDLIFLFYCAELN